MLIAVCDDDHQILAEMQKVILEWAETTDRGVVSVKHFDSAEKLLFHLDGGKEFDAYFLDLELPGMNGFVLGQRIREKDGFVPIVFVTNSDDYLLRGYELQVVLYLKKPIQNAEIFHALDLILKKNKEERNAFRMIRRKRMNEKLYYREIMFVVSGIHSVEYAKTDGERLRESITQSFETFAGTFPQYFLRCHRGYLVNMHYIRSYNRYLIMMEDGTEIPIGRNYQEESWKRLQSWFMDPAQRSFPS